MIVGERGAMENYHLIHIPKNAGTSLHGAIINNPNSLGKALTYLGHDAPPEHLSKERIARTERPD